MNLMGLRHYILQVVRGLADPRGGVLDHLRDLRNLAVGFLPLLLVHVFPDGRDRLGPVSRVGAGRVNLVLEPGPFRKTLFIQEQTGDFQHVRVQLLQRLLGKSRRTFGLPIRQRLRIAFGTLLEQLNRILHGRKIHVRRHDLGGRRHRGLAGIRRRGKDAFLQLQIAFGKFVLLVFEQLLQLGLVFRNGLGLGRVIDGDQVGARQAHHRRARGLRQGAAVGEIGVDEMRVPVEIVVDGMILVAIVLAAKLNAQSRDAGEILKRGVVRSVAQGLDQKIAALADGVALLRVFRLGNACQMRALKHGGVSFRVLYIASHRR